MPTAEILSQGDEVVTGQVADTNAAWLATRLTELGFTVLRHTSVGDRLGDLQEVLREIAGRADVCVGTGGLGPTEDDLTADAVAGAFGHPLELDEVALAAIEARYRSFGRVMPEVNRKQALLPASSARLDNDWGTAPGFALEQRSTWFAFLPGVPREMRPMFEERVLPQLRERFQLAAGRLVTLRTIGVGESDLQQRIGPFSHPGVVLGFRTKLPENHVKLRIEPSVGSGEVAAVVADLAGRIRSPLFTIEGLKADERAAVPQVDTLGGDLVEVVARALAAGGHTLATAESCTGGRIAGLLTAVPGASGWFVEGTVTYANEAKVRLLGVEPADLAAHGAVSEVVARQMAEGARMRAGTTFALSATGVAGPGGGSEAKPVGSVHLALATPDATFHRLLRLPGDRARIQALAAASAVDLLRRHLFHVLR